jgi:hypothetical protein
MIEAAKAENARGVSMRAGKKYTSVAVRNEIARRHLGDGFGTETEIIQWAPENGSPIVVKATIRKYDGTILATGFAEEIRGKGNVNTTSALENAETSAIGRALAGIGLNGGEFASANEMDGVERKREALAERQPIEAQREAFRQSLGPPHDPETGEVTEPRDHSITTDEDSANLASWKDGVLDRLPAGATTPEKAKALLVQFLEDLDKYKAENWLEKYIASRRPVTAWMGQFADLKPVLVNGIARARARVRGEDTRDFADISERMVATGNVGG